MSACFLYRHFDEAGNLLYVGISLSAVTRLAQHTSSPWFNQISRVEIERCATRKYAAFLEALAIETERPVYNRAQPHLDCYCPINSLMLVAQARAEVYVKSWDPAADQACLQRALIDADIVEAESLATIYSHKYVPPPEGKQRSR